MKIYLLITAALLIVNVQAGVINDADNDGIADEYDQCPATARLHKLPADFKFGAALDPQRLEQGAQAYPVDKTGCEIDSDHDGVIDSKDFCPDNSKLETSHGVAENGCPLHSDFDGTPDYRDLCPKTPQNIKTDKAGCPVNQTRSDHH